MLTGENGIITQASKAGDKTNLAEEKEKVQLAVTGAYLEENGQEIQEATLDEEVGKYFKNYSIELGENDEGIEGYIVTITDTGRRYFVTKTGIVNEILKVAIVTHMISPQEQVPEGNTVTITVTAKATEGRITKITKPDGTVTENTTTTTYGVTDNGIYKFTIEQSNGGICEYDVKVSNAYNNIINHVKVGDYVNYNPTIKDLSGAKIDSDNLTYTSIKRKIW